MDYLLGVLTGAGLMLYAIHFFNRWKEKQEYAEICKEIRKLNRKAQMKEAGRAVSNLMNEMNLECRDPLA